MVRKAATKVSVDCGDDPEAVALMKVKVKECQAQEISKVVAAGGGPTQRTEEGELAGGVVRKGATKVTVDCGDEPETVALMKVKVEEGLVKPVVGLQKCGELVETGARIYLRFSFEVEDGVTKCHTGGVGFSQRELVLLNDYGMEEGSMRVASKRLEVALDNCKQGWRQTVAGYFAEGKLDSSWRKLRLALGLERKRGQ